jgi:SAM-dependent MidA family methyltransferase
MLTSPNFPGPSRELLVARYYVNEIHYVNQQMLQDILKHNAQGALAAWEYGKDAWNSYFWTIDRQITPKVGDKFDFIAG